MKPATQADSAMPTNGRRSLRKAKGQAMVEFAICSIAAVIILFVGIQLAAIARYAIELNHLCYQITRWATDSYNNNLKDSSDNPYASPQCSDVINLLKSTSAASVAPYGWMQGPAPGWVGNMALNAACGAVTSGGIGITMTCTAPGSGGKVSCSGQRPAGTQVQIAMSVDTKPLLFLSNPLTGNYSFLGVPLLRTLSSTSSAFTQ
jgi:hypothetical protein